jgi:hypothetical protein
MNVPIQLDGMTNLASPSLALVGIPTCQDSLLKTPLASLASSLTPPLGKASSSTHSVGPPPDVKEPSENDEEHEKVLYPGRFLLTSHFDTLLTLVNGLDLDL